eukprot:gene25875-biopygen7527
MGGVRGMGGVCQPGRLIHNPDELKIYSLVGTSVYHPWRSSHAMCFFCASVDSVHSSGRPHPSNLEMPGFLVVPPGRHIRPSWGLSYEPIFVPSPKTRAGAELAQQASKNTKYRIFDFLGVPPGCHIRPSWGANGPEYWVELAIPGSLVISAPRRGCRGAGRSGAEARRGAVHQMLVHTSPYDGDACVRVRMR